MKNTLKTLALLALVTGALVSGSCHKDHHYTMNNQDFVTQASSGNTFEIQAGTLAQQKSSNASVKAFGSQMVTDHTQAGGDLDSLASRKGWVVTIEMLSKDRANLDTLTTLTGTAFDKKFAAIMVTSHVQTVNLFEMASGRDGVPDADVRAFAAGKLPKLREHLQLARQLQDTVGK